MTTDALMYKNTLPYLEPSPRRRLGTPTSTKELRPSQAPFSGQAHEPPPLSEAPSVPEPKFGGSVKKGE